MGNEFWALQVGKVAFKVLAWISAVLGLVIAVAVLAGAGGPEASRLVGLVWIVVGALYFLIFYVMGQGIQLLLEIREILFAKK